MSTSYLYDNPDRLETRKPYSYAPVRGHDHSSAHAEARSQLVSLLEASDEEVQAHLPKTRLRVEDGILTTVLASLGEIHEHWGSELAPPSLPLADILDGLIQSLQAAPVVLLSQSVAARWARSSLETLLARFECYGCIHAEYDHRWRRTRSSPNPPAGVTRLALLSGWLAWASTSMDRPRALAALNVTMKLLDLASSGVRHHHWDLDQRDRARLTAAIRVEGTLVESWRSRATGGGLA